MSPTDRATVLIVTFQRLCATQRCVESVLRYTNVPIEFVFVDNASGPELQQWLLSVPGTRILLERNIGFYRALNLGFSVTKSEFVAILDCDIVVSPGWWETLAEEVARNDGVGLAGSRYLNPDGSLQEGFPRLGRDGHYGANQEDLPSAADCQYIAIGCSVTRRSAWDAVGGFDEQYFISHGDIDFCYKLRYEGKFRVRYSPNSSVVHDHGYGREDDYERIRFDEAVCQSDYARFQAKWENAYSTEMDTQAKG